MIKYLDLFSGIGAFGKALTRLNVDYELVGFSEIDKWAIESYSAIHDVPVSLNLGDISEIKNEDLPDADLVTYGFPCQDISIAGKLKGITDNTRSGLLFEAERVIQVTKPKIAIAENVKNLISKRFKDDFDSLLDRLDSYGYNNYWAVLNAKDYGIPQNRERVFIVSIRKDVDKGTFKFPEPMELHIKLRDLLEDKTDDKYTVPEERYKKIINSNFNQERDMLQDISNVCTTLLARDYKDPKIVIVKEATKKGYDIATENDTINIAFPNSETRRGRVGKGVAQTLSTSIDQAVLERYYLPENHPDYNNYDKSKVDKSKVDVNPIQIGHSKIFGNSVSNNEYAYTIRATQPGGILDTNYRIRKLTPLECWRLMGFDDKDYWVARKRLEDKFYNGKDRSNSQMYKQAGNSIVVDVVYYIFKELFKAVNI